MVPKMKVCYRFITPTKPFRFEIPRPEGFVVEEIINNNAIKKYDFYKSKNYKYSIFLMKKKNLNTLNAIGIISKILKIRSDDIGFSGLKDKNAITYQYISIANDLKEKFVKAGSKLSKLGIEISYISNGRKLIPGDLLGNKFIIEINPRPEPEFIRKFINSATVIPNYFGVQRFGVNRINHIIGYHILRREFKDAEELMKKSKIKYSRKMIKFFVNAYQSWIFNEILSREIESGNRGRSSKIAPIPGFNSKPKKNKYWEIIRKIHKEHGISLRHYRINELKLTAIGSERALFINVKNIKFNGRLQFELPKGSYATVFLNELAKVRCP